MITLHLIGIGTGNPDHVTMEARHAIAGADLVLVPEKGDGKSDLADLRRQIVAQVCDAPPVIEGFGMPVRDPALPYLERVERWHDAIAARWSEAIARHPQARDVALLVWGDPSLYDSTLRIAARLDPQPRLRVVAGITSLQALTAAHAIPLNTVNGPVVITTGRQLRDHGWPEGAETLAVMLDGETSFATLDPDGIEIWWGAFLGMENEVIEAGPLAEAGPRIIETRARAREAHGWIMDVYLLRR